MLSTLKLPIHYKLSTINSIMANANANAKQAYGKGSLSRSFSSSWQSSNKFGSAHLTYGKGSSR